MRFLLGNHVQSNPFLFEVCESETKKGCRTSEMQPYFPVGYQQICDAAQLLVLSRL